MAVTAKGTAHRHKDSRGKWVTEELPHTHDFTLPAPQFTAAEVTALKQLLLAHGPGSGGTTPIPNPPQVPPPDITPPTITNVAISGITTSGAIVTCTTSEAATVIIEYGSTIAYGSQTAASSSGTSHSRTISGLTQNTLVHFRVRATDTAGNLRLDTDRTFTTSSPSPPAPAGTFQDILNGVASGGSVDVSGWTGTGRATISKPMTINGNWALTVPAGGPGLSIFANGVTLDGDFSLLGPNGTVYTGLEAGITTRNGPSISGLVINGGTITDFGYGGMWLRNVIAPHIEGVTVEDCVYAGIMLLSAVGGWVKDSFVRRIGVVGAGANSNNAYGIAVSNQSSSDAISTDVLIEANTVEDVPTWHGLDTHGARGVTFLDNIVNRCRHGIFVTGGSGTGQATPGRAQNVITDGNTVTAPVGADQYAFVYVYSTGGTVTRNTATGWPANQELLTTSGGDPAATAVGLTVAGDNSWT